MITFILPISIPPVLTGGYLLQETLMDKYIGFDINSKKKVACVVQKGQKTDTKPSQQTLGAIDLLIDKQELTASQPAVFSSFRIGNTSWRLPKTSFSTTSGDKLIKFVPVRLDISLTASEAGCTHQPPPPFFAQGFAVFVPS